MISQKIAALLVLILFTFEAYGKTKKYSVEIFSRGKASQSFFKGSEDTFFTGRSYSKVNGSYSFSSQLMLKLNLSLLTLDDEGLNAFNLKSYSSLLYKFDRNTTFQVGAVPTPLGYYFDNLEKFSFMETNFGTLNLKSLYIGGSDLKFYSVDSVDFGVISLNKKINSRFNAQLTIGFPDFDFENSDSKSAFISDNISGIASLIYKAKPYEAFVTYSYRSGRNNKIYSTSEDDSKYFSNKRVNLFGLGGKAQFKAKNNKKILVKVRGETWFTSRDYARTTAPGINLNPFKGFGLCLKFWDCPQKTTQENNVVFNSENFNLNIVSAYVFPEIYWKRFKFGLLLGASSNFISGKKQSFKESLNYEYVLQGSYKLTKELSFVLEHFYQNNSNYPHKDLSYKSYGSRPKTNSVIKGLAVSLNVTFLI